ncbi:hypothetical protein MTO96_034455 [Rhipicephalus appendiculatus]
MDGLLSGSRNGEYRGEAWLHFIAEHMASKLRSQYGHSVGLDERPQSPNMAHCDGITEGGLHSALKRLSGASAAGWNSTLAIETNGEEDSRALARRPQLCDPVWQHTEGIERS